MPRIHLSPPHLTGEEHAFVADALDSGWVAPLGPHVDAFEREFGEAIEMPHVAAVASGTAALHLALRLIGVQPGDEVICPTFTFVATANPIIYEGASPIFIDSAPGTWTIDPGLVAAELATRAEAGRLPRAVVTVDLYGQSADHDALLSVCSGFGVPVVEDAAEALGALYGEKPVGGFGRFGAFSFNGNKMITTSGGGALASEDGDAIARARHLATQAKDPTPFYEHSAVGYNYRMSNVLAAIGRAQLKTLDQRVARRRRNHDIYSVLLADVPGLEFMPAADYGEPSRWLTCVTIDPEVTATSAEQVRLALEKEDIETRHLWKPLHTQRMFENARRRGGRVAERIFETGLCLPSGSNLSDGEVERVASAFRRACPEAR